MDVRHFDVASVSAAVYSEFGSRGIGEGGWGASTLEGIPFDVEDSASAFLRMKNGASVQVEVSWVAHQKEDDAHGVEIFRHRGRREPPARGDLPGWTRTWPPPWTSRGSDCP